MLNEIRMGLKEIRYPLVSVIVTNYNYEKYIIPCLRSIARQSYPHFKCLVVDDGSTDGSLTLLEDFIPSEESGDRFSLIKHEQNRGQLAAFKTGLRRAEGVFVVFVDADDLLFEDFLETHVQAHLDSLPAAFTCSNHYQINEKNEIISGSFSTSLAGQGYRYIKPRPLHFSFWAWTSTSSMMFRKTVLDLIMPAAEEHYAVCADNYLCHFANLLGGSKLIGTVHGCYRRHGSNLYASNPVIGSRLPTGNPKRHPHHRLLRQSILSHLLENQESFSPLLTERAFFKTLLRLAGPSEIHRIKKRFPASFAGRSAFFTVKLMVESFFLKARVRLQKSLRPQG